MMLSPRSIPLATAQSVNELRPLPQTGWSDGGSVASVAWVPACLVASLLPWLAGQWVVRSIVLSNYENAWVCDDIVM